MCVSGIYALKIDEEKVGSITTGVVDISLDEYTLNAQKEEVPYKQESEIVMPGQEKELIAKVKNIGIDCYVRAKIEVLNSDIDTSKFIQGISSDWKKQGDYYYYVPILKANSDIKIFDKIKIPEYFSEDYAGRKIVLQIQAQAIQARNFEPDYQSKDPWKGAEIKKSIDEINPADTGTGSHRITLTYVNGTKSYISVPTEFFKQMESLVPGDNVTGTIKLKGKSDYKKTKYYFKISENNMQESQEELLNKIQLTITSKRDGKIIYKGSILNCKNILLGEYNSNDERELTFNLYVPIELDNEYVLIKTDTTWTFWSEEEGKSQKPDSAEGEVSPQTGDFATYVVLTIFFISVICQIIILLLIYKEKKKTKEQE